MLVQLEIFFQIGIVRLLSSAVFPLKQLQIEQLAAQLIAQKRRKGLGGQQGLYLLRCLRKGMAS